MRFLTRWFETLGSVLVMGSPYTQEEQKQLNAVLERVKAFPGTDRFIEEIAKALTSAARIDPDPWIYLHRLAGLYLDERRYWPAIYHGIDA